nr:uncharacterized protein LOC109183344 [Ipomoea batatas]
MGDFKVNKKIKICGTVIGGTEQASIVQLFVAISENFDREENLKAIIESKTEKEFYLPLEVVGHYVVVKYTPMSEDGKFGEPVFVTSNKMVEMGKNHQYWSRHLGKIVRDRNICPMQVLSWKDIPNKEKQHMWEAVKECFDNPNIELYCDDTLEHMCTLWTNWRSLLNVKFVRPCKSKIEALKSAPPGVNVEDWKWLVTNKFMTEKFQDEIVKTIMSNPSLSNLEVAEKHFGKQRHGHVYAYGGGVKRKNFNDSKSTYIKELEAKLHGKDEGNRDLKRRMDVFESRLI